MTALRRIAAIVKADVFIRFRRPSTLVVFLLLSGLVLDALPLAAELFNTPEVQSVIAGIAGPYASHWLKAIGLITVLARMRTLRLKADAGAP